MALASTLDVVLEDVLGVVEGVVDTFCQKPGVQSGRGYTDPHY